MGHVTWKIPFCSRIAPSAPTIYTSAPEGFNLHIISSKYVSIGAQFILECLLSLGDDSHRGGGYTLSYASMPACASP